MHHNSARREEERSTQFVNCAPTPTVASLDVEFAQDRLVPWLDGFTMRDLANALVVGAFRHGFIETLHAGKTSELLADPSLSRITDLEMKKLNIEISARLAYLLSLFFEQPEEFARQLNYLRHFTDGWERHVTIFDLPFEAREIHRCAECATAIYSPEWQHCPRCGNPIDRAVT